jgi:hypothetical protein
LNGESLSCHHSGVIQSGFPTKRKLLHPPHPLSPSSLLWMCYTIPRSDGYLVELCSDTQNVEEYLPKRHPIPNTSSAAATAGQPVPIGFHTGTTCTSVGIMFQERSIEGEGLGLVRHIHMANAVSLMQVRGAAIKRGLRGALVQ